MATLPHNCDRARAWVSLKLDGELSELEGFMLESHLARCEACRAFATDAVRLHDGVADRRPRASGAARLAARTSPHDAAGRAVRRRRRARRRRGRPRLALRRRRLGPHACPSPPRLLQSESPATVMVPASYEGESLGLPQAVPAAIRVVRRQGLTLAQGDF